MIILLKIWEFIKKHWKKILIVLVAIFAIIFYFQSCQGSSKVFLDILSKRHEVHAQEIKELNRIHSEEIRVRDEALKTYQRRVEEVETKYQEDIKKLNTKKTKQIKEQSQLPVDELTKKISEEFGFEIVPSM